MSYVSHRALKVVQSGKFGNSLEFFAIAFPSEECVTLRHMESSSTLFLLSLNSIHLLQKCAYLAIWGKNQAD
jgi:hypothetical protein